MRIVTLLVVIGFGLLMSCNDESSTGAQFFNGTSFEFTSWDTLTLDMSTIKLDSITTSAPAQIFLGNYEHEIYGNIQAESYAQVTPAAQYILDDEDVEYDSIVAVIRYNQYFLGDTTQNITVIIDEVAEEIEYNEDASALYNTSSFKVKSALDPEAVLGAREISAQPYTQDSVQVRLSDNLGQEWFQQALLADNIFSSSEDFLEVFNGIKISTSNANSILGFSADIEIKLYYTDNSESPSEQKYMSFTNTLSTEITFNHIEADYSGTDLFTSDNEDKNYTEIGSDSSGQLACMQPGIGMYLRLDIPHLTSVIEDNPDMLLESAVLTLHPVSNQYPSDDDLPTSITVYFVNEDNIILQTNTTSMTLSLDREYDRNTAYQVDIKEFIDYQLSLDENNQNGLLLAISSDDGVGMHYLTVGDQQNDDYQAQLILNIINLKNE